ncbi:AMP-binding protein [Pseudoalteromonas peptidolytica]|uniref:AMP-binding protein n=1 Tax=Pseudoalteromonas peptidolytica TaxID=61150 RepID=UPI00298DBA14|nr:AMP-binding protein [Pseudoalteromonas peptidolytica]MDW7549446.1 AMP-binding protein [Pseudoalteromonas peptidolytica]
MDDNYFWSFSEEYLGHIAVVTENGIAVDYAQLDRDINLYVSLLPKQRTLVFLFISNTYKDLLWYLSCLRAGHPTLVIDKGVDQKLVTALLEKYSPNVLVDDAVTILHEVEYDMHPDLAVLISTSGTTGTPKLVKLSKVNLNSNAKSIASYLKLTAEDTAITTLPMSYSFGLSVLHSHLAVGATVVLNEQPIMSREFWQKVENFKVTSFSGVPFTFQMLKKLKYQRFKTDTIRYVAQAGGKLDDETLSYFCDVCKELGQEFYVMYGQTEASPRISYLPFEQLESKIGSIGIAIPGGSLEIYAESEKVNSPRTEGEIVYKGPNVMMGYAESVVDLALGDINSGELLTGDLGFFDEDGYFYITGRAKRFIKLFGLRINLDAIDSWLMSRQIEAVSTGNDEKLVVFFTGKIDAVSIKQELVTEYKLNANYVIFQGINEIPRKNGGKIDFKPLNILAGI